MRERRPSADGRRGGRPAPARGRRARSAPRLRPASPTTRRPAPLGPRPDRPRSLPICGKSRNAFLVGPRPGTALPTGREQVRLAAIREGVHQAVDPAEAESLLDDLVVTEGDLGRRPPARPGPPGEPGAIDAGMVLGQPSTPLRATAGMDQRLI